MKKIKFFLMAVICLVVSNVAKADDDTPIPVEQLPAAAKSFVHSNFEGRTMEQKVSSTGEVHGKRLIAKE